MRFGVAIAITLLTVTVLAAAEPAAAGLRKETNIPAQGLKSALQRLAADREMQILYRTEVVGDRRTGGAAGELNLEETLQQLLSGSDLTFRYLDEKTITIVPLAAASGTGNADVEVAGAPAGVPAAGERSREFSFWERFRLAPTDQGNTGGGTSATTATEASDDTGRGRLEEIVVTAQKREERLIDVPQSVSVLSSETLFKLAATQFRDFANTVPGLSFTTAGAGYTQISLRGVTTGFDIGPTVGIYVDEVPYGSSGFYNSTQFSLDAAPFDLERIEVLRGPQGTLYGASSMGGLVKYVTRQPDATRFGVEAQTGISGTHEGGINYLGAIAANAPIRADKAALRVSSFYSRDGGYIDNVARDDEDVNRSDIYGARADLLMAPNEAFSIRITGFLQNVDRDGEGTASYANSGVPLYGTLEQNRPFSEPFGQRFRLISGTVVYDLPLFRLTSISSYQTVRSDLVWDISQNYVPAMAAFLGRSYSAISSPTSSSTDKFVQEIRLSARGTHPIEWGIGGFYTDESSRTASEWVLHDPAGLPALNDLYTVANPSQYEEYATFGDITWHLTDKFDMTGGIRFAHNRQVAEQIGSGLFIGSRPTARSSEDVVTYLANAKYQFSDRATVYARYATGYRPGGPNAPANDPITGLPLGSSTFEADRLKSYEVGFKGESRDRRFGFDLAAYDIDWSNVQIAVLRGGFGFIANAPGGAAVRGAELSLTAHPTPAFLLGGAFAYQDAKLSEANADLGAADGERLPNVPQFTATLNADYTLPLPGLQPTLGASLRYVDDRTASFDNSQSFAQYRLPEHTSVDFRGGLTIGRIDTQLYVHNVFDERGQLSSALPQFGARIALLQPRTIGLTASIKF